MTTALVRLCDTPKAVMKALGMPVIRYLHAIDWGSPEGDETVVMMRIGRFVQRVPILFSDGKHDDTEALDALYGGQWYYDVKRDTLSRWTSERVFINGPHLISRPLTREQRRRTYTDHPSPFVMNAYPERIE
jgi:hypothetical protein